MNKDLKVLFPEDNIFNHSYREIDSSSYRQKLEEDQIKEYENISKSLGIDFKSASKMFTKTDELISSVPNMVAGELLIDSTLRSGNYSLKLKTGDVYIMSLNTYLATYKDRFRGKLCLKPYRKQFRKMFNRYRGQDLTNKKLLISRTGGIGDILFSQPIVNCIKDRYPSCKITYATAYQNAGILKAWKPGLIDKIEYIPFSKKEFIKNDYHLFFEGGIERNREAEIENCYDIFKKISGLDFNVEDYPLKLITNNSIVKEVKNLIPDNTIIIHIRASSAIRMMCSSNWTKIINKLESLGFNVAVIDSTKMEKMYEDIKIEQNIPNLINLSKYSKSLEHGIALLSLAKGLICIDSSFSHIASGLNIPVVGIYGPFSGDLRMRYYDNADWVDSVNYTECGKYPCFLHQHNIKDCPFINVNSLPGCLATIDTDLVVDKLIKLINKI